MKMNKVLSVIAGIGLLCVSLPVSAQEYADEEFYYADAAEEFYGGVEDEEHYGADADHCPAVGIILSEEFVSDGAVEITLEVSPEVTGGVLMLDDEVLSNERKGLPSRYVLHTADFENGEHFVRVRTLDEDGRERWAERFVFIENPGVTVRAISGQRVIWPGKRAEFLIETDGPVEHLDADLGHLAEIADCSIEWIEDGRFLLTIMVADWARVEEGEYRLPLFVQSAHGGFLAYEQFTVNIVSAEPMPYNSRAAIRHQETLMIEEDNGAMAHIVDVIPELVFEEDEPANMEFCIEGDFEDAEMIITAEGFSGYLSIPLAALEQISDEEWPQQEQRYRVPIEVSRHGIEEVGVFRLAIKDRLGRVAWFHHYTVPGYMIRRVADYSVYGTVDHQFPQGGWAMMTETVGGLKIEVRGKSGSLIKSGIVDWAGNYNLTMPTPNASQLPYSIRLLTTEPEVDVLDTNLQVHAYTYPVSFTPNYMKPVEMNMTITRHHSGAFHIFDVARRTTDWYRKHGATIGSKTTLVWSQGYIPSGTTSYYTAAYDRIHLLGWAGDPDQYDDSVIAHEIGHRVHSKLSTSHSPGGSHSRFQRYNQALAWSEGIATYFGQMVLGTSLYIDTMSSGGSSYDVDDLSGIPTGTHDGTEAGNMSEALVTAALWDLHDGASTAEFDNVTGLNWAIVKAFKDMKNSSNLNRGIAKQADFADALRLVARSVDSTTKTRMNTLLSSTRYNINWMGNSSFWK